MICKIVVNNLLEKLVQSMAICTQLEQINTVNVQLLIFRAKNLAGWVDGWMDRWMDGRR